jgi:hypothetical protein
MKKSTRRCPVPGCAVPIEAGHLMCKPCWFAVPADERTAVNRTYRAMRASQGKIEAVTRYRQAAEAAIEAAANSRVGA